MIRGFSIQNEDCFAFLDELIGLLNRPGSTWILDGQTICGDGDWIPDGSYSGKEFRRLFDETPNQYQWLVEMRLRMYSGTPDNKGILTFEQFLQSNCDALIMCADGADFDIYLKDQDLIQQLSSRFSPAAVHSEILTEETDGRTRLSYLPDR